MALRDWSARRILGVWTGWMSGLLVALLAATVLSPTGVTLTMSPAVTTLGARIAIGVIGLVGACLPPAILTYVWYAARVRAWSDKTSARERADALRLLEDDEQDAKLSEGSAGQLRRERGERVLRHRRDHGA